MEVNYDKNLLIKFIKIYIKLVNQAIDKIDNFVL